MEGARERGGGGVGRRRPAFRHRRRCAVGRGRHGRAAGRGCSLMRPALGNGPASAPNELVGTPCDVVDVSVLHKSGS